MEKVGDESRADREAVKAKIRDSQAAARELLKDANQLTHQARVLRDRAGQARDQAHRTRGPAAPEATGPAVPKTPSLLVTVPTACRRFGVCERTLRRVLKEPGIKERTLYRNHRVGIFYRYTLLLPPDLVDDLAVRLAELKRKKDPPGEAGPARG